MKLQKVLILFLTGTILISFLIGCNTSQTGQQKVVPEPEYFLKRDQTHNKFSSAIPPVLRVPSGAIIEAETKEASDNQITPNSSIQAVRNLQFDPIHPITGPVFVEGAEPGDVLAVTLHLVEPGDWGWVTIIPNFGFLADEFKDPYLKLFSLGKDAKEAHFSVKIAVPLNPFPGIMGVAPDTY